MEPYRAPHRQTHPKNKHGLFCIRGKTTNAHQERTMWVQTQDTTDGGIQRIHHVKEIPQAKLLASQIMLW